MFLPVPVHEFYELHKCVDTILESLLDCVRSGTVLPPLPPATSLWAHLRDDSAEGDSRASKRQKRDGSS